MATVPEVHWALLDRAFAFGELGLLAEELRTFARELYQRAFDARLKDRTLEDNRGEHELVVLRYTLRICCRSGQERESGQPFDRSDYRVAIATALLHDLRFIRRITEQMIAEAERSGRVEEAAQLRREKTTQRMAHMQGGAEDAGVILRESNLVTASELRRCLGYISLHDAWKLDIPYPLASDWLAVCCLEGDALYPFDPEFGPLADLQRQGIQTPTRDQLRTQALANLNNQLRQYRKNFRHTAEPFQDDETILRTREGARILAEALAFWGI